MKSVLYCFQLLLWMLLPSLHAHAANSQNDIGWYAWQGMDWVQHPQNLSYLPVNSRRLLLSFTAQEWDTLLLNSDAMLPLQALHADAQKYGVTLELLLGEPTWVLPEGRARLMSLLQKIPVPIFSKVHLDLERNQLPVSNQEKWSENLMLTLRQAVAASPVPVALTTHHRELLERNFLTRLGQIGITEIIPMIYATNTRRVEEIVRQFPPMPKEMHFSIAQSMEEILPHEESSFVLGQHQALQNWQELADQLRNIPGFRGIMVQSWEDYLKAKP